MAYPEFGPLRSDFRARGSTEPEPYSVTLVTDRLNGVLVAKLR